MKPYLINKNKKMTINKVINKIGIIFLSFFIVFNNINSVFAEDIDKNITEINLEKNWDFYYGKLLISSELENENKSDVIDLPFKWSSDYRYSPEGCVTFVKTINIKETGIYSLYVPVIDHAYNLYLNDELLTSVGNVACDIKNYEPKRKSQVIDFYAEEGESKIIIQVSNFDDIYGGIGSIIKIGNPKIVSRNYENKIIFDIVAIIIVLAIAFYSLIVFALKDRNKIDLAFVAYFLTSFFIVIRIIFGDYLCTWLFPNIDYGVMFRISYSTLVTAPFFFIMFLKSFLYAEKKISRMYLISLYYSVVAIISIIFLPLKTLSNLLIVYQTGLIMMVCFAIFYLVRAFTRRVYGTKLLILGFLIMTFFIINDLLYCNGVINTGYYLQVGIATFALCQSLVLSGAYNKTYDLCQRDPLTNVYNKRYLFDYLEKKLAFLNEKKRSNVSVALAMVDIDHFKAINDTYGHEFGDYILKTLSEKIENNIRKNDVFARYGGEEFVMVFNNLTKGEVFDVCERIRHNIKSYNFLGLDKENKKISTKITISIGIVYYKRDKYGDNYHQFIKAADMCLYNAKNTGRDKVVIDTFDN